MTIFSLQVHYEHDVVRARQRARQIAGLAGLSVQMQTRFATAVSELARNAFSYAKGGQAEFAVEKHSDKHMLVARVSDSGPGIPNLSEIMDGRYRSRTGMGVGLLGTKRLMDHFSISSAPEKGTAVTAGIALPAGIPALDEQEAGRIADALARQGPQNPYEEIQCQNQELLDALGTLREREEELLRINRELEDTNRGVVALYAELDEKANYLRRADELKGRFLSDLSHELRTPLNSILAISQLLLDRTDGDLTAEQEKQVDFVKRGAQSLSELVNDLLDIAKIAAGKITVRVAEFDVPELFSALRGMLRPLQHHPSVSLVIEEPKETLIMETDESKVAQILRNLISNALKYTEQGQVHVTAAFDPAQETVVFKVEDTGIGISRENLDAVFQEFVQIENHMQRRLKGTGLGLPLSRRLVELLGGTLTVESAVGVGSTFTAVIPSRYPAIENDADASRSDRIVTGDQDIPQVEMPQGREKLLLIEDDEASRYLLRGCLNNGSYAILEAADGAEGLRMAWEHRPSVIFLDLVMQPMEGMEVLERLKADPATCDIPVIIYTSRHLSGEEERHLKPLVLDILSKETISREVLYSRIRELLIAVRRHSTSAA